MADGSPPTIDRLNEIGVLKRREIEARLIAPWLDALGQEFGRERVLEIAREVIIRVAHEQGAQLAGAMGGNSMAHFAASLEAWKKDDALEIEVLEQSEDHFSFNVTRGRYAEMYRALGWEELGATLSCNRDGALIEGFNEQITLTRTQTILQGAPYCDFRFQRRENQ
jgi:predicted ArsR family transcriptional regulator